MRHFEPKWLSELAGDDRHKKRLEVVSFAKNSAAAGPSTASVASYHRQGAFIFGTDPELNDATHTNVRLDSWKVN